jgi:glycosyltransferase involved in cell wall biosynthesis
MNIKDKLTIVIPCKNEEKYIEKTIINIVKQYGIRGTRVIIADALSTDGTRGKIISLRETFKDIIKIELVNGGTVSFARNFGASITKTPYVLFMDADTILIENDTIQSTINHMIKYELVTCKIKSVGKDFRTSIGFKLFNFVNKIVSKKTPFAIGTFFMTRISIFNKLGGFDESLHHSEDYVLSKKYNRKKFKLSNKFIGQDDRRFKKMGYLFMVKLLIKGYLNRNNIEFYRKSVNYW